LPKADRLPSTWKEDVKRTIEDMRPARPGVHYTADGQAYVEFDNGHDPKFEFNPDSMLQLIEKSEVGQAAEYLWSASRDVPEIRALFPVVIQSCLYVLAGSVTVRPATKRTAKRWRELVAAMEEVLEDGICFKKGEARAELERAIEWYKGITAVAHKGKPKDYGARRALLSLRDYFMRVFGNPMTTPTALFMRAAGFGNGWNDEAVRRAASEWAGN
jgi:hypothetical protein